MHRNLFRPLFVLVMAPSVALAQTPSPQQDGRVGAPATSGSAYQSAFADYKPYTEPVVMSWLKANEQVRDTGGMQGHDMANMKSQSDDPHAGHDMSKLNEPPRQAVPGAGDKTNHDAHSAPSAHHPVNKEEKE